MRGGAVTPLGLRAFKYLRGCSSALLPARATHLPTQGVNRGRAFERLHETDLSKPEHFEASGLSPPNPETASGLPQVRSKCSRPGAGQCHRRRRLRLGSRRVATLLSSRNDTSARTKTTAMM